MKKKLLLILPTQYDRDGTPVRRNKASVCLNLNLPLLAGYAKEKDWDVRIVNDYVESADPTRLDADLVAVTTLIATTRRAYEIGDAFRRRGKKVVMGGFHATAMPEEVAPHCDALVMGEADEVWPRVLDDFLAGTLQEKYVAERHPDLTQLAQPRYDLIDQKLYKVEVYPIESSRGCPHRCDYCAVTQFHGGQHRLRPIGDVVRDAKATGSRYLAFVDDNISGHREHARELFTELCKLDVRWMAQSTMYLADDPELLDLAVKSGLRFCWIGVESIHPEALAEVHRNINQVAEFERRIREFQKRGVMVGANMMFGFDSETEEHYEETARFLERNKLIPFLYILTPIPGTKLYDRMHEQGRILTYDWNRYTSYETVFQPKNWSPEKQNELYFKLAQRMFNFQNNWRRTLPTMRWSNFKEDFAIRLAALIVGLNVGRAVRGRWPTTW